jgi:hypothetical protein
MSLVLNILEDVIEAKAKIDHVANAVSALKAAGYKDAGETATHHVRIPTTKSPVHGGGVNERGILA